MSVHTLTLKRFCCILLLVVVSSCIKKTETIPDYSADLAYYPLSIGHWIEYEIDSLVYNPFTHQTEQQHFQWRDDITDTFRDNSNRLSYWVKRAQRADSTQAWQDLLAYYITPAANQLQVVENQLRFIKMVFPIQAGTSWNGNIYIPVETSGLPEYAWYDQWPYTYTHIGEAYDNGLQSFPITTQVQVDQLINDSTNAMQYSTYTHYGEVYAKEVGMVYRLLTHWEYQPTQGYRNGFSVLLRAKNYH